MGYLDVECERAALMEYEGSTPCCFWRGVLWDTKVASLSHVN